MAIRLIKTASKVPITAEATFAVKVARMILLSRNFFRVKVKNTTSKINIIISPAMIKIRPFINEPAIWKKDTDMTFANVINKRDLLFLKPKRRKIGSSSKRVANKPINIPAREYCMVEMDDGEI